MIDIAEWLAARLYALRITTWQQWVLRLLLGAAGLGAALLSWAWVSPVIATVWLGLVVGLVLFAMAFPDTLTPLFAVGLIAWAWLGGGAAGPWWQQLAVVALVAVFHLAAAYAGAAPAYAVIRPRARRRMALAGTAFVLLSVVAAGAVLGSVHV